MALSHLTGGIFHSWHTLGSLATLSHAVCVLKLIVCSTLVPATRLPASFALIPPGLEFLDNSVRLVNLFDMSHCFVKRADSNDFRVTSTLLYNK